MLHSVLHEEIRTRPFRPFRIQMAGGSSYDVRFREAMILTPTLLVVGLNPNAEGTVYERVVLLDLMSIAAIEHLPITVSPKSKGQSSE